MSEEEQVSEETEEQTAEAAPQEQDENETEGSAPTEEDGEQASEPGDEDKKKPFKGFQKRVQKLSAELQRERAEKEALKSLLAERTPPRTVETVKYDVAKPRIDDFASYDEYTEALTDWKVDQRLAAEEAKQAKKQQQKAEQQIERDWPTKIADAAAKYADFEDVVINNDTELTEEAIKQIKRSDIGGDVLYYLGKNPDAVERLMEMSGEAVAREIGRIEGRLESSSSATPAKVVTSAPKPLGTPKGKTAPSGFHSEMSYQEFKQWREKQLNR